jgi:hypothetical protein
MSGRFGDLLAIHLSRGRLSQKELAKGIHQDPAVISLMCHGKRLVGPYARERVLEIIRWLGTRHVLDQRREANTLLQAAGMSGLDPDDPAEAALLGLLRSEPDPDVQLRQDQAADVGTMFARAQAPPREQDLPDSNLAAFVAGPAILHPRQFFGREQEVKRLFSLWRRWPLQHAAVIGPRRSGKTSLLRYVQNITVVPSSSLRPGQRNTDLLPEAGRYRWVYVDFQDARRHTREGFQRYVLESLEMPVPHPLDLDHFIETVARHLRSPAIVLLDEMGAALERCPELDDAFWEALRALAATEVQGKLAFMLAADDSPDHLARRGNLSSPFFNIFAYVAPLGPLTESEARELIGSSPIPFSEHDIEWILAQSKRWPLLLQILCRECLVNLEEGGANVNWRKDGLRQIAAFKYLSESPSDFPHRPDDDI